MEKQCANPQGGKHMATVPAKQRPEPSPESIESRFRRLAAVWDTETGFLSSMEEASKHPAYQEIIGMGPAVVPFLLRDMQDNHQHWFIALRRITGAQPVPLEAAGNIPRMVEAWLAWGRENGYRW